MSTVPTAADRIGSKDRRLVREMPGANRYGVELGGACAGAQDGPAFLIRKRAMRRTAVAGIAVLIAVACPALAEAAARWANTYLGRVEVLAEIETLNGALLASRSATATLEAWCAGHHMATPPRISADRVRGIDKPITAEQRQQLQVGPDEPIRYRRVRLVCGTHVLSEADNWYVPGRLTPEMNSLLDTTDTPFGQAVQPLHPVRQTLSAELLWSPLPPDWDRRTREPHRSRRGVGALAIPADLLRHRAILSDDQHRPLAEVVETYTGEVLNFP
jgi:hypothetical protein